MKIAIPKSFAQLLLLDEKKGCEGIAKMAALSMEHAASTRRIAKDAAKSNSSDLVSVDWPCAPLYGQLLLTESMRHGIPPWAALVAMLEQRQLIRREEWNPEPAPKRRKSGTRDNVIQFATA